MSAYHYNIVANMMLLTCATHLMSVAVVQEYWKYPVLALLRIIVVTGAFLATGIFLSAQDATGLVFPTAVPPANATESLIFLPATCFGDGASLRKAVDDTFHKVDGERIHGWSNYLAMLVWYVFAVLVEVARFFARGKEHGDAAAGWRARASRRLERSCGFFARRETVVAVLMIAYLVGGIAISTWTVASAGLYIVQLRSWVKHSGWMQLENGDNPEDDATTFGQLVPIFLCALTLFSFCQIISGKCPPGLWSSLLILRRLTPSRKGFRVQAAEEGCGT